ncbi:MAG: hypothetical protein SGI77_00200 [Pirellulaceae bacterium]|nr:hypothetical protein [Pirellulaceae bacterium]
MFFEGGNALITGMFKNIHYVTSSKEGDSLRWLAVGVISLAATFLLGKVVISQDSRTTLPRPDWQLRAELEFKLRLQQANRELCGELFAEMETASQTRQPSVAQNLRQILPSLFKLVDDQPPTSLPDFPASVVYIDARQAAFVEYSKVLREHSKQPTDSIVAREASLQKELRASFRFSMQAKELSSNSTSTVANSSNDPSVLSPIPDAMAHQATVKNMAICMRRLVAFAEFVAEGDTSAEKSRDLELESRKVQDFFKKQKDWILHYPILDVTLASKSILIKVDSPLEFAQLQLENPDLKAWISSKKTWSSSSPAIVRRWDTIKPNDYLRIMAPIALSSDELFEYNSRTGSRSNQALQHIGLTSSSSNSRSFNLEIVKKRESKPAAISDSR